MNPLPLAIAPTSPEAQLPFEAIVQHLALQGGHQNAGLRPESVQALLALATRMPVNPNAWVNGSGRFATPDMDLLSFVLNQTPRWTGHRDQELAHRTWPSTLGGFANLTLPPSRDPEKPVGFRAQAAVDTEWLAAVLLAAGADPWAGANEDQPWGRPVEEALRANVSGLLTHLLSRPDAPSVQTLFEATGAIEPNQFMPWGKGLLTRNLGTAALEALLRLGARVPEAHMIEWLEFATVPAIQLLAEHQNLPTEPATQKKLATLWRARAKRQDGRLDPSALATVLALLDGKDAHAQARDQFGHELTALFNAHDWNEAQAANTQAREIVVGLNRITPEWLLDRVELPRGPMAGRWSGASAVAFNQLRFQGGTFPWSFEALVQHHYRVDESTGACQPGALAATLGFEWRPGVPVDGLFFLALFGMGSVRELTDHRNALASTVTQKEVERQQRLIAENLTWLGVEDPDAWARTHVHSAVRVLEQLLSRPTDKMCNALASTWHAVQWRAMQANAGWVPEPDTQFRLLQALHGQFTCVERNDKSARAQQEFWGRLDPLLKTLGRVDRTQPITDWAKLSDLERKAGVEVALIQCALGEASFKWVEALRTGLLEHHLGASHIERMHTFMAAAEKDAHASRPSFRASEAQYAARQLSALLMGLTLEQQLSTAPQGQDKPRRPRL